MLVKILNDEAMTYAFVIPQQVQWSICLISNKYQYYVIGCNTAATDVRWLADKEDFLHQ